MANIYSAEDKLAFKRKDLLNSKMSSLKAASLINEGNLEIKPKQILKEAQKYFDWLIQEQDFSDIKVDKGAKKSNPKNTKIIPTPTLAQKKVLDIIQQKSGLGSVELYPLILEWSLTIPNVKNPAYPQNESSVELFMKWLGEKK